MSHVRSERGWTSLPRKMIVSLRYDGWAATLRKLVTYPARRWKYGRLVRSFGTMSRTERFTTIYDQNVWGANESVSGHGSTLDSTESIRRALPALFREIGVRKVLDVPCGDFNWMRHVVAETSVVYIGGDIVPRLIERNRERYGGPNITFIVTDITTDPLPDADLWMCRDCLFHLSYADVYAALRNFAESQIPYLLTTTHICGAGERAFENTDIVTGDFRLINLFAAPFCLPADVTARVDDWIPPQAERALCLWTRQQISDALPAMARALGINESTPR